MNVIEKFREFWNGLTKDEQKDLWDIFTALRANDSNNWEGLKALTTCRIRGELLGINNVNKYGAIIFKSFARAKKYLETTFSKGYDSDKFIKRFKESNLHWLVHTRRAIRAISRHVGKRAVKDLKKFLPTEDF